MDTPVASSTPTSPAQTRGNGGPQGSQRGEPDQFSRALLSAMLSFKQGDFSARMPADLVGVNGKIADAFNDIAAVSERRARETARVSHSVGKEGKLKQRMSVAGRRRRLGRRGRGDQHADRRPGVADDRSDARGRRRGQGRSRASRWRSKSTAGRSKASSCARRSWSTR